MHYRPPIVSGVGDIFLDNKAIQTRVNEIIEHFDVRPRNPLLPAKALSGGNQQKLIIGREFHVDPKLLLVSQPTRGVDIGAIEFIHRKLVSLRDAGCAILLVSAELEEVTSLADRLLVIHEARLSVKWIRRWRRWRRWVVDDEGTLRQCWSWVFGLY